MMELAKEVMDYIKPDISACSPYFVLKAVKVDRDTTVNLIFDVTKAWNEDINDFQLEIYNVAEIDGGDNIIDSNYVSAQNYAESLAEKLQEIKDTWTDEALIKAYHDYVKE